MDKSLEKNTYTKLGFFLLVTFGLVWKKKEKWILQMLKYLIDSRCLLIKGYYK